MAGGQKPTRCLLCSLACPVALSVTRANGAEEVSTEYVEDDPVTQGRLCFRGHYLAELAAHPFRLTRARKRNGEVDLRRGLGTVDETLAAVAECLREAGGDAAVVVDGNLPTEAIVRALRLGLDAVGTRLASVYLPDTDIALLQGLRDPAQSLPLCDVADSDAFLIVGDAFATHPVISRPVLDAKAERRAPVFALDCMPNRVTGFAQTFLQVFLGGEAPALAALCKLAGGSVPEAQAWAQAPSAADLAASAGLDEGAAAGVAEALSRAERPAVLLAPTSGRSMNVTAAAAAASALATACGARLLPLFRYGNAVGAGRAIAALQTSTLADIVRAATEGKVRALVAIGVDLFRAMPRESAERLRSCVRDLIVASTLPNATTDKADMVLPMAAWFEQVGTVDDATGEKIELSAAIEPPGGALSPSDICARLAAALGQGGAEAKPLEQSPFLGRSVEHIEILAEEPEDLRLIARSDGPDLEPGRDPRALAWPRYVEPEPEAYMRPSDIRERGLTPRSRVTVRANHHEAQAWLRPGCDVRPGSVCLSTGFPETTPLFRRATARPGETELAPAEAEVTEEAAP